jgi:hypothetical protein
MTLRYLVSLFTERTRALLEMPATLHDLLTDVRDLRALIQMAVAAVVAPPTPAPMLVSLLVMGFGPDGKQRMLGASRRLEAVHHATQSLRLRAYQTLTGVSVVIFCDMERVDVRAIMLGNEILTIGAGAEASCPIATCAEWPQGMDLQVTLESYELRGRAR